MPRPEHSRPEPKNWPSGQDQGLPSLEHIRSIGVSVCVCVSIRHVCVGTPVNPAKRMRPPRRRRGRGANLHRTKEPCIGWGPGSPTRTSADRSPSPLESSLQADSVVDAGVPRCKDLCGVGDAAWPAWHGSDCRVRHRKRKCAKNCNK